MTEEKKNELGINWRRKKTQKRKRRNDGQERVKEKRGTLWKKKEKKEEKQENVCTRYGIKVEEVKKKKREKNEKVATNIPNLFL